MRVVLQSIVRNMVANLSWEMDAHLLYISALPSWEKQSALDRGGREEKRDLVEERFITCRRCSLCDSVVCVCVASLQEQLQFS